MNSIKLFRTEALNARQNKWLGDIVLTRPKSFALLVLASTGFACAVASLMYWGTYTKRSTVPGQLVPDQGLVKVYAPQYGIVVKKKVEEGLRVRRGDVLYVLTGERRSSQGDTQASISRQVQQRQQSLRDELEKTRRLQQSEKQEILGRLDGLKAELAKISSQTALQKARVKLAEEAVGRWEALSTQQYISKEQVQQRQADLLDQRTRLQSLERDSISLSRDLATKQAELDSLPLRQQNQLASIERILISTGQELAESEVKRVLEITSPEDGVATAVVAENGQTVDPGRPVVSIVPDGSSLQAHLYAPSRAVGFLKPDDPVQLRYHAYPYQKFGHAKGRVATISRVAVQSGELAAYGIQPTSAVSEPVYRITVTLDTQTVTAYGKRQNLYAGMLLDADVMQETRRLYEWMIEPLYSLTGKL